MMDANQFAQFILQFCNSSWPIIVPFVATLVALGVFTRIMQLLRENVGVPPYEVWAEKPSSEAYRLLMEKRKNDAPEEKEKPTAWYLGDDGEMVPVVSKRKNDDLFHLN